MAARTTRDAKVYAPVEDLLPRWRAELAEAGYRGKSLFAPWSGLGWLTSRPDPTSSTN